MEVTFKSVGVSPKQTVLEMGCKENVGAKFTITAAVLVVTLQPKPV